MCCILDEASRESKDHQPTTTPAPATAQTMCLFSKVVPLSWDLGSVPHGCISGEGLSWSLCSLMCCLLGHNASILPGNLVSNPMHMCIHLRVE
jgi:hypothetical protein